MTMEFVRKAKKSAKITQIEELAAKIEPELAKVLDDLLAKMGDTVDLDAIIAALQAGDVSKVISLIAAVDAPATEGMVAEVFQEAVWAGGALTAAGMTGTTSVQFVFNRLNPRLIDWMNSYTFNLIKEIKLSTREAIREKLASGMTAGQNPIKVARGIKEVVGLTRRQAQAVENFRKELETFHLKSSAKGWGLGNKIDRVNGRQVFRPDEDGSPLDGIDLRRNRDFRFDPSLKSAMSSGKPIPPDKIDKMVAAYARKYRQYRARTIARTEALRATNFGVQDAWRQAIEAGSIPEDLVRRQWIVSRDERLCEICAPIPKLNPKRGVKFGQPFVTPNGPTFLPPIHPNCRCTVFIRRWEPIQLVDNS